MANFRNERGANSSLGKVKLYKFSFLVEMTKKSKQPNNFFNENIPKDSGFAAMTVAMALQHMELYYQLYYGLSGLEFSFMFKF